jgi:hypothetical protein
MEREHIARELIRTFNEGPSDSINEHNAAWLRVADRAIALLSGPRTGEELRATLIKAWPPGVTWVCFNKDVPFAALPSMMRAGFGDAQAGKQGGDHGAVAVVELA